MTEEEIEKQAIEFATEQCGDRYEFDLLAQGFIAGAKWGIETICKELVARVEKDQSERQVQTINVLDLKAIIKEMGVEV